MSGNDVQARSMVRVALVILGLTAAIALADRGEREERGRGGRDRENRTMPPAVNRQVSYLKDVQPILEERCGNCHANGEHKGHFRIDTRQDFLRGGEEGPAVRAGDSARSKMVRMIACAGADPMPPKGDRLTSEQIGIIRAWIDQGLKWEEKPRDTAASAPRPTNTTGGTAARGKSAGATTVINKTPAATGAAGEKTRADAKKEIVSAAKAPVSFVRDIKPILSARCADCHADGAAKGGFSIDSRAEFLKGGKKGPAVAAGDSGGSKLIAMLAGQGDSPMPPKGKRLSPDQVALFRAWIDQGARWDDAK